MTFGETGAGCASAVKAWFYPGDNTGNRFVYGKKEAEQMAKSCRQPVPHVPTEVASAAVKAPEVKTVKFDRTGGSCAGTGPGQDCNAGGEGSGVRANRRSPRPMPKTEAESPVRSRPSSGEKCPRALRMPLDSS